MTSESSSNHTRSFSLEDQHFFAGLCGDWNPLHVDPVAARRLLYGQPVVHGIHLLLRCLEESGVALKHLQSLTSDFKKPAFLDRPLNMGGANLAWGVWDQTDFCVDIKISLAGSIVDPIERTCGNLLSKSPCADPAADQLEGSTGSIPFLFTDDAALAFPHWAEQRPGLLAFLLASTRLIGATCPGLHSLYSQLTLETTGPIGHSLEWEVTKYDARFSMLKIKVSSGGVTGSIRAFRRPEPVAQMSLSDLIAQVPSDAFVGQRALVIGGSRGLGEACSKILAAGGADVCLTYNRGQAEALVLQAEAHAFDKSIQIKQYSCLETARSLQASLLPWSPTDLYYFAAPKIAPVAKGTFPEDQWRLMSDFFVDGFIQSVAPFIDQGLQSVFYPSTIFIDEQPPTMGPYVRAKEAAETHCDYLRNQHNLEVRYPRLPKMATDQTQALMGVELPTAVEVLIKVLLP